MNSGQASKVVPKDERLIRLLDEVVRTERGSQAGLRRAP